MPYNCGGGGGDPILLRVSPNPVGGTLNVETIDDSEFTEVRIFSDRGNLKKQFKYPSKTKRVTFSVGDLQAGIYLLQVFDGPEYSGWKSQTFIKQ